MGTVALLLAAGLALPAPTAAATGWPSFRTRPIAPPSGSRPAARSLGVHTSVPSLDSMPAGEPRAMSLKEAVVALAGTPHGTTAEFRGQYGGRTASFTLTHTRRAGYQSVWGASRGADGVRGSNTQHHPVWSTSGGFVEGSAPTLLTGTALVRPRG